MSGGVAQLGERLPCTQEAIGSIPFTSTIQKLDDRGQISLSLREWFLESLFEVFVTSQVIIT
jgi:hypothetical protein